MKTLRTIFIFTLLFLSIREAWADDIMGVDMTYRCLGNDSFEFTTIVYKDCNANWQIPGGVYNLSISAVSCSYSTTTVSPQLVSCVDITPICAGYCTKCNSTCNSSTANGSCSFPYGIEKLTFRAIVYLGNTSCCKFNIGYIGNSTRNTATTTCCNTDLFYTYVELNKCLTPCNSSPIFTNDPVGIICAGQDFVFNNGVLDSLDGDSMTFELAPALKGQGTSATYYGSFSYLRPLTFSGFPNVNLPHPHGFHLDGQSGDLSFRPTQANQIAVIVVKVKEWRKVNGTWENIGETRRDMQFIIVACSTNNVPEIKPPNVFQACAGQKICVDIETDDDDNADTVRISWNAGIRGATFSNTNGQVKHPTGEVCWTPTEQDISNIPYTFTITAKDNACPITGQAIKAFSIFVRETPEATLDHTLLNCGKVALSYTPKKTYSGFSAQLQIYNANNELVHARTDHPLDTAFLQPGKHTVFLNFRTGTPCYEVAIDSFEVPSFVQITSLPDTFVCKGQDLMLNASTIGGSAPYAYQWTQKLDTVLVTLDTTEDQFVSPDTSMLYWVQVTDNNGCSNWDTVRVDWIPPPAVDLGPDLKVCAGEASILDAGTDSSALSYLWVTGDTTRKLSVSGNTSVWARVKDSFGCVNYDTLTHSVAVMNLFAGNDLLRCEGDTITITGNGADSYRWYNLSDFSPNPLPVDLSDQPNYTFTLTQPRNLILRGVKTFDSLTCVWLDTLSIDMNPAPAVTLQNIGPYCPDDNPVPLITAVQFPTLFTGTWSSAAKPNAVSNNIFYPGIAGSGNHVLTYRVMDNKGCTGRKNILVNVQLAPPTQLVDSLSLCMNTDKIALNILKVQPASYIGLKVDWFERNQNASVMAQLNESDPLNAILTLSKQIPPGVYYMVLRLENNSNGCASYDTTRLRIQPIPATDAGVIPAVCWNDGILDLDDASGASPSGGIWSSSAAISPGNTFQPSSIGVDKRFTGEVLKFFYETELDGCSSKDSVMLTVKALPQVALNPDSFCMTENSIDLNQLSSPGGSGSTWTGTGISENILDLNVAGSGHHSILYDYEAPNGCENSISGQVFIQAAPEISAEDPGSHCADEPLNLDATLQNSGQMVWTTSGDGQFANGQSTTDASNTDYTFGSIDLTTGNVIITGRTMQGGACPEDQVSLSVPVFPIPEVNVTPSLAEGCQPLEVIFDAISDAPSNSLYEWSFGEGAPVSGVDLKNNLQHLYSQHGTFAVQLTVTTDAGHAGCSAQSAPVYIQVYPKPVAIPDAAKWVTSSTFPGIQFYDASKVASPGVINEWQWLFGDPAASSSTVKNPFFEYPLQNASDTAFYWVQLRVGTENDCWDTAGRMLIITPELSVFIPNAFSPNGYGEAENEYFTVVAENYVSIRISVFTRWGERIFFSDDINKRWDGTYKGEEVQQDVYMYLVEVVSIHGKTYQYSGTLTVLR